MQVVPLFPLPNVVLFPEVPLPLHVFEPRYKALVSDALASHRTIGMTLLRPGFEADYHARPPVYPIGCTGTIVEEELLEGGRYNILLRGLQRFRVVEEQEGGPYRLAFVEPLPDAAGDQGHLQQLGEQILAAVNRLAESTVVVQGDVSASMLVNGLCQKLDLPIVEKQDLLACDSLESRAGRLVELLNFHSLERSAGRASAAN